MEEEEAYLEREYLEIKWISWPIKGIVPPWENFPVIIVKDGHVWVKKDHWNQFIKLYS